jgi:hypothetical protein
VQAAGLRVEERLDLLVADRAEIQLQDRRPEVVYREPVFWFIFFIFFSVYFFRV